MMDLNKFSEDQLQTILAFTNVLVAEKTDADKTNFSARFNDIGIDSPESEADAERQSRRLIESRKAGRTGRVLADISDDDRSIREQVRRYLKVRKHYDQK